MSVCKTLCNLDVDCKGYVTDCVRDCKGPVGKSNMCQIATTSQCPHGCSPIYGAGNLYFNGTCGVELGGCFYLKL